MDTTNTGNRGSVAYRWVFDPTNPRHLTALGRKCEVCAAGPGVACHNTVTPGLPLPGRIHHYARSEA